MGVRLFRVGVNQVDLFRYREMVYRTSGARLYDRPSRVLGGRGL